MPMLKICGIATYLPTAIKIAKVAKKRDLETYKGWPVFCRAGAKDQPSKMAIQVTRAAIKDAGISAKDVAFVIFNGISRDYPPSWSVSIEIMRSLKMDSSCIGLDYTVGCLGTLMGLKLLSGLLDSKRKKYAVIVCAEKWSYTVDRQDSKTMNLWGHADGAGAIVVGSSAVKKAYATFSDVEFSSYADFNDLIRVKYGGTKFPVAPKSEKKPFKRILDKVNTSEISKIYQSHLESTYRKLTNRLGYKPDNLVINQMPLGILERVRNIFEIEKTNLFITGDKYGHVGSADIIIGLEEVFRREKRKNYSIGVAATSPCQFGVGILKVGKAR